MSKTRYPTVFGILWVAAACAPRSQGGAGLVLDGVVGATLQTCAGPDTSLAPGATQQLTCDVQSPLGGSQMLVLPEMYVPGNGCIVTTDKPRVVMVGNNFGVSATFTNRCITPFQMSEAGLGWLILELGDNAGSPVLFNNVASGTLTTCIGPNTSLAPSATQIVTCDVVSPLGGSQMLVLPEMYVPGNGCIVAADKPRVVMVGNNFGVSATFTNRCITPFQMSEAGLGWLILELGDGSVQQALAFDGVLGGELQTCAGPNPQIPAGGTQALTCDVQSPLGGSQMLVLPEMHVPGNGCIVASQKPQVVLVGNNFGVNTVLQNRCGTAFSASEGGLGWTILQLSP